MPEEGINHHLHGYRSRVIMKYFLTISPKAKFQEILKLFRKFRRYCISRFFFFSVFYLLKVHKIEIFFGFDFEICIISLIVM
jgi:hypothetical protein